MHKLLVESVRVASLSLALAAALTGCGKQAATPDGAVLTLADSLREGSLGDFLRAVTSPDDLASMQAEWTKKSQETPSEAEKQSFEETMAKLTASNAVDELYAEIEPALPGLKQQWAMVTGMLPMLASGAAERGGVDGAEAQKVAAALSAKIAAIDIANAQKIRSVLEIVTKGAVKLDLKSYQDLQELSFDGALDKSDVLFGVAKDVLGVYGLSLDETFSSVAARVVTEEDDQATVELSYELFGSGAQTSTVSMARIDGRWIPRK